MNKTNRTERLSVRVSKAEADSLRERVKRLKTTLSKYLRKRLLGHE